MVECRPGAGSGNRPVIAVTCERRMASPCPDATQEPQERVRPFRPEIALRRHYADTLAEFGCLPLLLAPTEPGMADLLEWASGNTQGLLISGGIIDIDPATYGQEPLIHYDSFDSARTQMELGLARSFMERGLPVLGICGGMQVLAVATGGSLLQDLYLQMPGALEHQQPTDPSTPWHEVRLQPGLLHRAYGTRRIMVNSTHHQAVADPGALQVSGRAPDGVIEAIELRDHPFCVGVQWHPEALAPRYKGSLDIYKAFCETARIRAGSLPTHTLARERSNQ